MRDLTGPEIEALASPKGVKRVAVENFLGTMGADRTAALMNMNADARSYRWNRDTVRAILDGIRLATVGA